MAAVAGRSWPAPLRHRAHTQRSGCAGAKAVAPTSAGLAAPGAGPWPAPETAPPRLTGLSCPGIWAPGGSAGNVGAASGMCGGGELVSLRPAWLASPAPLAQRLGGMCSGKGASSGRPSVCRISCASTVTCSEVSAAHACSTSGRTRPCQSCMSSGAVGRNVRSWAGRSCSQRQRRHQSSSRSVDSVSDQTASPRNVNRSRSSECARACSRS